MKKVPTVFQRDPEDMSRVTDRVHPDCGWVLAGEGRATRKFDGTCVMLDDEGRWWARREVKPGKSEPVGFVEVDHDTVTGKRVGWEPVEQSPFAKFHAEGRRWTVPGTYELVGPKINGNPEGYSTHTLIPHGRTGVSDTLVGGQRTPKTIRDDVTRVGFLGVEGIVYWHDDGRMAKIKSRDYPT